jgi:hypothetical protein
MIGACRPLSCTLFYLGYFEAARQYAMRGVQIWRSGNVQPYPEDLHAPIVSCLCQWAMSAWYLGETAVSCQAYMNEAISTAKELNDMNGLVFALAWAAGLGHAERNPAEVDRLASDLIELSTRHSFVYWLAIGAIYRGWARSASGDTVEGIPWYSVDRAGDKRLSGDRCGTVLATFPGSKGRSITSGESYLRSS